MMVAVTTNTALRTVLLVIHILYVMSTTDLHGVQSDPGTESPQECDFVFKVKKGQSIDLHIHNFTKSSGKHSYCTLQATTEKHLRIVLDLVYSPPRSTGNYSKVNCSTDYVHVGNDAGRVDVDLMTSYKFCGEDVRHELASKSNYMWIVYKASQTPKHFFLKVRAQAPVMCTMNEFPCSPTQCVDLSVVCDGVKDCTNGHDEFCHRVDLSKNYGILSEPCFRCGDGTCIQPRLSMSDISYGRVLWYLCDGYSHCPDAWDERQDICKHLKSGHVREVTECVPYDLQFGHNGSVLMWNEIRCDANPDCYHGEDEKDCYDRDSSDSKLRADPATLGAVVGILVTAVTVICVTYRLKIAMKHASRPSTSSTVDTKCTQCTTAENDRGELTTTGQACSEATPVNIDMNDHQHADTNMENDEDGHSLSSVNLRHTFV